MCFHHEKCIVIRVPGKRQFHQTSYTLYGHTLDVVDSGKYLGVTINKDLTWTKHINQTIGKASKTIGFLSRNLGRCTTKTKATAYTTLVRPVLEYASSVWDPHQITTTRDIEQVQRRAARVLEAFPVVWLMCFVQVRSLLMVTPRYFPLSTTSRVWPCNVYDVWWN
jgi:hypothetical protein